MRGTPLGPHLRHQLPVLGVDPGHGADVLAVLQGLEELAVPQHELVLVGHEELEGVDPVLPHQLLHLSLHLEEEEEEEEEEELMKDGLR